MGSWARHTLAMSDDARKQLQERFAQIGAKALARVHSRIHESRPELQGKTLEETIFILKEEERLKQRPLRQD
jgi:hypothetical protein